MSWKETSKSPAGYIIMMLVVCVGIVLADGLVAGFPMIVIMAMATILALQFHAGYTSAP